MNIQNNSNSADFKNYEFEQYRSPDPFGLQRRIILHDAPAGAGKTYGLCKLAIGLANSGQAVLFVQPTNTLIGETIGDIAKMDGNVSCRRMDETNTTNVVKSITNYLKNADQESQILLITHSAFERLRYIHRPDRWNLIIDEALQVHNAVNMRFKRSHLPLTSLLGSEITDDTWSRLQINDHVGLAKLKADMPNDDSLNLFAPAINLLESKHWQVFVRTEAYQTLCAGESKANAFPQLYAIMNPSICSGFKSVHIAGARIQESLLVNLWKSQGVLFSTETFDSLKFAAHDNCERVKIYYGIKGHWSKYLRNKHKDHVWTPLIKKVKELSSGNEFIYVANNDMKNIFPDGEKATRLSNMPHGLNKYQHINMVAFFSALNLNNQYVAFLESQGLLSDEINCDVYYHKAYQAIMRGGIRNHEGSEPQVIVVPDESLAVWLQSIFTGSQIEWLGFNHPGGSFSKPGRPAIYTSNAERNKAYRGRLSTKDHLALWRNLIEKIPNITEDGFLDGDEYCDESPYITRNIVPRFRACIWDNYWSTHSEKYIIASSHEAFIEKLKEFHKTVVQSKTENKVMTLGCPAPNSINMRKESNIVFANGIMLDNDGGELTPEQFTDLFPRTVMVIYNTYSSTTLNRRWRAYIPTEFIMTPAMYKNVINQILKAVEKEGYNEEGTEGKRKDGFDRSKKGAADLLHLPCQAAEKSASFFLEFSGPERKPLDPTQWINFDEEPEIVQEFVLNSSSGKARNIRSVTRQEEIDFEIERWRMGNVDGNRNDAYSTMYYAFKRKGIFKDEIIRIMTDEAMLCATKKSLMQD